MKIVYPGSFDPITVGHLNVIKRASLLGDELIVAVLNNTNKRTFFSKEDRIMMIKGAVSMFPNVRVEGFEGLTVEFCNRVGAHYIVRGLRNPMDYMYEKDVAVTNFRLGGIETIFLPSEGKYDHINSTIVRELITFGADIEGFVPKSVIDFIKKTKK